METATPGSAGFVSSLRALGDGLLATTQDRLDLFSIELQEEKFRLIQTFIWISAAVCVGMMSIAFASLTLVYLFRESSRLAVLCGLTFFFAGALVVIIIAFRRFVSRHPVPFTATRREIGEDRACIQSKS